MAQKTTRGRGGCLNLAYVWGLFHTHVPGLVARFRRKYPEVTVNLFDLTATQQAEAIAQGRVDAGFIGFAREASGARLAVRKIGTCSFVAALPLRHPASRRRSVPLSMLARDFFFTISEQNYPGASRHVLDACREAGFRPRILQSAERGHTILSLVAGQCGVALLPEPLRSLPHPGVVFRPLVEPPSGDLVVVWNPARAIPLRDAFLTLVRPGSRRA